MLLRELTKAQVLMLGARIAAGEKIFIEAVDKYFEIEVGDILELKTATCEAYHGGRDLTTFRARRYRCSSEEYIGRDSAFKLAPDATKVWNAPRAKVVVPELADIEISDGLGQPINVGDVLALCDNGSMVFSRYEGFKGVNTLNFRDVRNGQAFKRMPSGLCRLHRSYKFDHSLKISDKPTLDKMVLNKLAA